MNSLAILARMPHAAPARRRRRAGLLEEARKMEIMPTSSKMTERTNCCLPFQVAPMSNTGGALSESYAHLVMMNGKVKEIILKRGNQQAGFIDTLTVVLHEDTFIRDDQLGSYEEIAANCSAELAEVMGYGISFENKGGRNFYEKSYQLGDEVHNYGFVAVGGRKNKDTVCLHFTGEGLIAAKDGWELRLYEFLSERAKQPRISRCDVAHDFLNGEYTCEQALKDWEDGGYTLHYSKPISECVGGDWKLYKGTGKTFYVGSRKNASRFARIYEKGKQLGDELSPWVRAEVEFRARDIIIPLDILIAAGEYLTACYPVFGQLFAQYGHAPSKPERIEKEKEISIAHVGKYASMQVSRAVVMYEEMGMTDKEIITALKSKQTEMPKRLAKQAFDCAYLYRDYIHQAGHVPRDPLDLLEFELSGKFRAPKTKKMNDTEIEICGRKHTRKKLMEALIFLDNQERKKYEESDEYVAYAQMRAHGVPHCLAKAWTKMNKAH